MSATVAAKSQVSERADPLNSLRLSLEQHDPQRLSDEVKQLAVEHSLMTPGQTLVLLSEIFDEAQHSKDRELEASALHAMGQMEFDVGRNDEATKNLQEALQIADSVPGNNQAARIRVSLCAVYGFTGHPNEALEALAPVMTLTNDAALHADALTRRAEVFSVTGKLKEALADTNEALALERSNGLALLTLDTDIVQANVLNNLGEPTKASGLLTDALTKSQALHDRRDEGRTLSFQGEIAYALADYSAALILWNQALLIERESEDRPDEATTLHDIGAGYWATSDPHRAIEFYEQSRVIQREVLDKGGEAVTLTDIGNALADLGELQKAISSFDQALAINRIVGDTTNEAITLHSIAALYQNIMQTTKAINLYQQALVLEQKTGDNRAEGKTLGNLACLYQDLNQPLKALALFKEGLRVQRKAEDHRSEAVTLHDIGTMYLTAGQQSTSRTYFEQALALEQKAGDRRAEAYTRWRLASLSPQSLKGYLEALQLAQTVGDADLAGRIEGSIMRYYRDRGSMTTAILFGKQAVNEFQLVRLSVKSLGQVEQDQFVKSRGDIYRDLAELLFRQDRFPEAEQVVRLLKKQEHTEFARGDGGAAETAPLPMTISEVSAASITADEMQWLTLKALHGTRTPEQQAQYSALDAKLGATNRSFTETVQSVLATRTSQKNVMAETSGLQNILRQLADRGQNSVGVYTLVSESELDLIVVTGDLRLPPKKIAISRNDLTVKVREMRLKLQDPCSDPKSAEQVMYKLLLSPILADLKGAHAKTIVWELDGALRYIPMSALYDGSHYLAESYRSVIFSAGNQSGLIAEAIGNHWNGLGFGTSEQRGDLEALPSVTTELHGIFHDENDAESTGPIPGHIHMNKHFDKETFASELEAGYTIVHIASHFVLKPGSDQSYLVLGAEEPGRPESGRLTYAEMRDEPSFHFDSVQLLTLSACQTGTSVAAHPQDGAEVDALGDLAAARGAKAVMATLWNVNDASTGEFMMEFYKDWKTGSFTPKSEALRQAQASMLHNGVERTGLSCTSSLKHPYYWAPFILIGNWQ